MFDLYGRGSVVLVLMVVVVVFVVVVTQHKRLHTNRIGFRASKKISIPFVISFSSSIPLLGVFRFFLSSATVIIELFLFDGSLLALILDAFVKSERLVGFWFGFCFKCTRV